MSEKGREGKKPEFDDAMEGIFQDRERKLTIPQGGGREDLERQGYYRSASMEAALKDNDALEKEALERQESSRRAFSQDDLASTGHSAQDFAHNHPIMTKLKSSGHTVRKKGRKASDKAEHMEGIQESVEGVSNPAQDTEEGEDRSHSPEEAPSSWKPGLGDVVEAGDAQESLPWKRGGQEEGILAEYGAEIPSSSEAIKAQHGISEGDKEDGKKGGVFFHIGDDNEEPEPTGYSNNEYKKKSRKGNKYEPFSDRYRQGSDLQKMVQPRPVTPEENTAMTELDREDIGTKRFEKSKGLMMHKIDKTKDRAKSRDNLGTDGAVAGHYGHKDNVDHTPHELFVEMDELEGEAWVERARWIKYEEDLEAERGQWGKPHVASLTFHSLLNLRRCLEQGTLLLDIVVRDLPELLHRVVEDLSEKAIIEEEQKAMVLRVLLYRHKHVHPHNHTFKFGLKRSMSQRSIQGLLEDKDRRSSTATVDINEEDKTKDKDHLVLEMNGGGGMRRSSTLQSSFKRNDSFDNMIKARKQDILACMEEGTEGSIVLVGALKDITQPIVAFVRLAEAIEMPNTIEVSLPVRFIVILLTPHDDLDLDHHEIGRSMSTLMSNPAFHNVCYRVQEKMELLHGINDFLDDSVVLPPGDWDRKNLLPMAQMMEMRKRRKERKAGMLHVGQDIQTVAAPGGDGSGEGGGGGGGDGDKSGGGTPEKGKGPRNPLKRTRMPFGGLIDDIRYRYPDYLSDIKDGFNTQVVAATIFIYFAALSGAIAFGGLMGAKTKNDIGISETLVISCCAGIIFSLFAGCPLIIIGVTGPVLLYDESLYKFCQSTLPGQYLFWRVWIGIWTFVIALVVAGFQGSTLVRYFTKFTKDIFASLVSLLFIYEAFNKLSKIFKDHPLMETVNYCSHLPSYCQANESGMPIQENCTSAFLATTDDAHSPNTALLSMILMFGTFFIAYFLRLFRNSQFFGRNARRALGDFGVPIAIVIMVAVDYSAGDTFTEKLVVPEGIKVTNSTARGWLISPTGTEEIPLKPWAMFAAILPAILLYLLLFMETHICELIMMEKTKEKKGAGLHLDIVLLSLINFISGFFGGPWICAATVRAVSHVSALTVMSTTNAPGESPKVVGIRDQRISAFTVSVLLGVSILMAPILKLVPFAVLFGVFLYMGVSGMNGVQFFDRVRLCFMPVKHHPNVSYVQNVKTWRMVMFTILQAGGLVLLWVVKSTKEIALAFPFFVILMIPYRFALKYIFTERELNALDGAQAGTNLSGVRQDDEEKDFYETAADCPITPTAEAPLHRAVMGLVKGTNILGSKK